MSTQNLQTDERIATRRLLGIDAEGREHRWDMVARTVYVLDEGELYCTKHVGERPLGHWVAFVEQKAGWETLHFSASPFDKVEVLG